MSYFKPFPLVLYPTPGSETNLEWQVNLTRRSGVPTRYKNDNRYYYLHSIRDHETPEVLADKLYNNVNLAWVILQFNDIVDMYKEWPLTQNELLSYVNAKYEDPYKIHHYISIEDQDLIVEENHPLYDRMPITNMEHEEILNDKKRTIKLPNQDVVNMIVKSHNQIMRS